jgi:hypothetical protein
LTGLVYGLTPIPRTGNVLLLHRPLFWGAVVAAVFLILQVIFW